MNPKQIEIESNNILKKVEKGMAEIAPLVTKSLMEKFEKNGISPVFSKDGRITGLKVVEDIMKFISPDDDTVLVDETQWKNLENEVKDYKDKFWFLEYDQTQYKSDVIYPVCGKLLVVSRESGRSKEYNVGQGSTFPYELIQDIKNNFFKN
ncbi:MAG: hypothetical protein V4612_07140 [Pseudomonadota bacterium]